MQFDWNQEIAGVPLKKVRDFLRHINRVPYCLPHKWFGTDANKVLEAIEAAGYMERKRKQGDTQDTVYVTGLGSRLCCAKALPRLKRPTAERLLREVLLRAVEVNASSRFLMQVKRLAVFGSLLTDVPTLGDVDLGFDLADKPLTAEDRRLGFDLCDRAIEHSYESEFEEGRSFRSYEHRLYWPEHQVKLHLRNRSGYLSLHPFYELEKLEIPHVLLIENGDLTREGREWWLPLCLDPQKSRAATAAMCGLPASAAPV